MTTIEFHEVIAKLEERFRPELDDEAKARFGGTAEHPGKYEPTMVSTGWWMVLARFGVAVRVGSTKPDDLAAGDQVVLTWHKRPGPITEQQFHDLNKRST